MATKTTKRKPKKTAAAQSSFTIRRELWAMLYGVLAIIVFLCLCSFDGFLLKWLRQLCGGLLGTGIFVLPFCLGGLCALLFVQRKGPIRLRGACIMLLPIFIGAITQSIIASDKYPIAMQTFADLLSSGIAARSGGLLGGWLYILLEWALSSVGALLILLFLTIASVMTACKITPEALWNMLRPPKYEYDSEEERARYEAPTQLPNLHMAAARHTPRRAAQIDIPIDDEPVTAPKPRKKVISPAELIEQQKKEREAAQESEPVEPPPGEEVLDRALSMLGEQPMQDKGPAAPEPLPLTPTPTPIPTATPAEDNPFADLVAPKTKKEEKQAVEQAKEQIAAEITLNQQMPAPAYVYPELTLLNEPKPVSNVGVKSELAESSQRLIDTLDSFGIEAKIINIVRGPSVTRFELTIERGIKFSRITALSDDIALALGAISVRIAPIPDKMAIGVEVPNKNTLTVYIREVLSSQAFQVAKSKISFAVGKNITGAPVVGDIAKMPHMLIAGTTGSGKSVCINSMLISLLYKATPEEVRLIMIDPKMVELGNYNGVPHLLIPVVTDPQKASGALNWAVGEMERRYKAFAENQVRNLVGYNEVMRRKKDDPLNEGEEYAVLPQIVIVIDELADLMMVAAKEVETSICRLAQKARAAGMHLIVATQRPSADVITGIMKANIPSRIAFAVASQIESRIILDTTGAEKLIGKGDMLYAPLGEGKPTRIQGCFISNEEIEAVITKVKESQTAEYSEEILEHIERQSEKSAGSGSAGGDSNSDEDELLSDAIEVVVAGGQASTSMLQRRLKLGYARAARIVDQMEQRGIISASDGAKPRQVLISKEEWQEMKLRREIH